MGTAEHTDALTRRIEQLAAAALDEGDGAALAALIAALRSEIGAVRVDVGTLRAETGGVRTDLDGLEERLVASVDAGRRETGSSLEDARGVLESRLAVLEDALDGLSERLESLARDGAGTTTRKLEELDATVRELDARLGAQGAQHAEQVVDRLGTLVEERLAALQATIAEQSSGVAALTSRFAGLGDELAGRLAELTTVVDERTATLRADLTQRMEGLEGAMSSFRTEWPTRTFEVVQGARAVAEGVTREVRVEVGVQLDRVRHELARGVEEVGHAREGLDAQSTRLAEAGKVLVTYLEQRDRLLEAERDRVLHDVLDSFATGLSSRERTALASRMGDAVARRRDARDAERYRSAMTGGTSGGPGPGLPPELTLIETEDVVRALSGRVPERTPEERSGDRPEVHPPSTARGALAPPPPVGPGPAKVRSLPVNRVLAPGSSVVPPPAGPAAAGPAAPGRQSPPRASAVRPAPAAVRRRAGRDAARPARAVAPPLERRPGAPGDADAPQTDGPAPAGTPRRAPGRGPAGASAGTSGDRRGRLSVMPEVPSVDVALDLGQPPPPRGLVGASEPTASEPAASEPAASEPAASAPAAEPAASAPVGPPDADDGVQGRFRRRPRP